MVLRRLGKSGQQLCLLGRNCPQILQDENGDFVAVGAVITDEVSKAMPPGPGIGPKEGAVRIPRGVMVAAWAEQGVA
jgi:hypothetical protein